MSIFKEMYPAYDDILLYSLKIITNNPNNVLLTSKSRQEATSTDPKSNLLYQKQRL